MNSSPPYRPTASIARTQPLRHDAQDLIASRMTLRVVDGLEVIDVDHQYR